MGALQFNQIGKSTIIYMLHESIMEDRLKTIRIFVPFIIIITIIIIIYYYYYYYYY